MMNQILYRRNFLLHLGQRPEYDEPVLFKEPVHEKLTSWQVAQLHTEYVITRQLANVPGIRPVYAIEGSESHPVLLLEYIHGQSLSEVAYDKALDLRQKLQLAVEIAGILADIHEEGVIHGDITSHNILVAQNTVSGEPDGVSIIDFGLAKTMIQDELTQPRAVDAVAGSLAYVAPEQTSRLSHSVDPRSDLYSLGVTMYEIFTGRLPFQTDDPLKMNHAHMAILPVPPRQRNAAIPEPLSEIILKLMAKNADDRYQSAQGLGSDLVRCLHQLQGTGKVEPFELGQDDFSDRLRIPQKLYGRQSEISQLVTTYNRVAQGNTELLFVAGYSGVGKTSLVHEIRIHAQTQGGVFIEGKFDQLPRSLPYSAWTQAFNQLFTGWLAESDTTLARWRETILEAVGDHGQILIDIIPALERVIGTQPEVPLLGGVENQNRLNYYFNRFIRSLATPEHPLVVFLDDLQWIDLASLSLIEALIIAQRKDYVLIIGAYRDSEVGPSHPLLTSRDRMGAHGDRITVTTLGDLTSDDTNHLLADTLTLTVADCRELSQILQNKTGGNPFYVRQQLHAVAADGSLRFDRLQRRWVWDMALLKSLQVQENIVELMLRNVQALPANTQSTLSIAACIGNRFDPSRLSTITGRPQTDILADLSPALQRGLIIRLQGHFLFSHDRVQEAVHAVIPKSDLAERHLEIGRLLLAVTPGSLLEKEIFEIASHLNAGRTMIDADSEKLELARLNLMAAQRAKAASAYADGKEYVEVGIGLLGPDSWQNQYELTLSLYNEYGELAALTGQHDQVYLAANLIHANAKSFLDQAQIYMVRIEAETMHYNPSQALQIGIDALKELGTEIPMQPSVEYYQSLERRFVDLMSSRSGGSWAELPNMSDESALAASSLLASIMSTSYIVNPPLFPLICYHGALLTLEYGLDAWSSFFFGGIALVNTSSIDRGTATDEATRRIQFTKQLIEVIRKTLANPVTARGKTKGLMMLAFVVPWIEPLKKGIEIAQATHVSGYQTGDTLYGSYGAYHYGMQAFVAGLDLVTYQNQLVYYVDSLRRMEQVFTPQLLEIQLQTAQNLSKTCPEPHELNGTYFEEDEWLPSAIAAHDSAGRHTFYIYKLLLAYHFDVDHQLEEYGGKAEDLLAGGRAQFTVPVFYLYFTLSRLRLVGNGLINQPAIMDAVDDYLLLIGFWSQSTPTTFQHMYHLIAAEKARVLGDFEVAFDHFEQAISDAREHGFTHDEALANELYARFWLEKGNRRFASLFMREAHNLYRKWGALAKAEHLTKHYPDLMVVRSILAADPQRSITYGQIAGDLDILTVMRASQAIAGEIELDGLLQKLMTIAIESSGAQLGFLLLREDGKWMIVAQSGVKKMDPQVMKPSLVIESTLLCLRIVHYVSRTQQTVLLEDAVQSGDFVDDPYVQHNNVRSLLCTPLVDQGKTGAILYLENNLSPGIFTPERVSLVQLLSSQMAISIDNARSHHQLENLLEERSRALNSAEAQIHSLFDNSPLGISLSGFDGRFLTVNQALLDMLGISEEEMQQQNVTDFYADPGERALLLAEVQEAGSVQSFGVQIVRNDGSSFFASLNMNRLNVNDDDVLLTMVEDVTDELKAEQEIAALDERQRLAHELHDSVSQTLFSAGMIADAMPRLWGKDLMTEKQNLELLSMLIRGASAEMRSLLLELRPDTLRDQTLGKLLETLALAARARTQATVTLNVEDDQMLPDDVTLALHRIAQESLNNIAKHAEASKVVIDVSCGPENVALCLRDDGRGFDPQVIPAGHLGIGIMRERAKLIGATIQIDSSPGDGTMVSVDWTEDRGEEIDERSSTN